MKNPCACIQSQDVVLLLNPCFGMQLIVEGVNPDTRAVTMRAYNGCNSYLSILHQGLRPTHANDLSAIPEVNATFLQALASLGASSSSSSSSSSTATDNVGFSEPQAIAQLLPALPEKGLTACSLCDCASSEHRHKQGISSTSCSCLTW